MDDIVGWVANGFAEDASLSGAQRAAVVQRAEAACRTFSSLDTRIRALGIAPMLAPVDWTFLMLHRASNTDESGTYFMALGSEPWLHIGLEIPRFLFNPENEWGASKALALQLALRREFLDSGWRGEGQEWEVTFRDGNSAKESMKLKADSAGAAFAWAAAARGAMRIAKQETVRSFSLVTVAGPEGVVDAVRVLAEAMDETVINRGRLIDAAALKWRGHRKAA